MTRPDVPTRPRRFSPGWWVRDRNGRIVVAQAPNPAILVWFAAGLARWTGLAGDDRHDTLVAVGRGALLVWGLDELARGSSPFRRLLGAVVLVATTVAVATT